MSIYLFNVCCGLGRGKSFIHILLDNLFLFGFLGFEFTTLLRIVIISGINCFNNG